MPILPLGRAPPLCSGKGSWVIRDCCLPHQTRPEVPLALGSGKGMSCPTQTGILSSQLRWLCLPDPAPLGVEMWPVFGPRPWERGGFGFWRKEGKVVFRGHSSGSPQLPSLYTVRPLRVAQAPDYGLPCPTLPLPLIKEFYSSPSPSS